MNNEYINDTLEWINARNQDESEFLQAIHGFVDKTNGMFSENDSWKKNKLLHRLSEPDRIVTFRISWLDDDNNVQINRGWRVQHCGVLGPYKGGTRFHPDLSLSILKFLAFEQTLKNALTGLSLGGGKGGSDFDPEGRSDTEIMSFCQAFVTELYRHIGENTDVPAGDINVGEREIGYMFGQYRRLSNQFSGAFTGKSTEFGGNVLRTEATGFGLIYFVEAMLAEQDMSLENKTIAISGAGNVALHASLKAIEKKAKVITLSTSQGCYFAEGGIERELIEKLIKEKGSITKMLSEMADKNKAEWKQDKKAWGIPCDIALPCATQNELTEEDAKSLVKNEVKFVAEGANMPCTSEASKLFLNNKVAHAPGKASNAGGVAISGSEMSQNASFTLFDSERSDETLRQVMDKIHRKCVEFGRDDRKNSIDYHAGASRAALKRLASAMLSQGVV